jgi:hypothetical protein
MINADKPKSPPAPGGSRSPQQPGKTPDRSTVPGRFSERVAKAASKQRPLTQYGTAEEIMSVFKRLPEEEIKPANFEQATASFEERRKANLTLLPPVRPVPRAVEGEEALDALPVETSSF